jgi:N-acetylglucosaminyldiphosphoundecaprenol N-acetyl-beta-D-mannosaminyltransferase
VLKLSAQYPGIEFACRHGYFSREEEPEIIKQIELFAPDILLVGLGAPKQELWNAAYQGRAGIRIGVGGTIDVLSGQVKRAPKFFRDHNLEWLYRLACEPRRIHRQIVLPLYMFQVLREKFKSS